MENVHGVLEALIERREIATEILQRRDRHGIPRRGSQLELHVQMLEASLAVVFVSNAGWNDADGTGRDLELSAAKLNVASCL